MRDWLGRLAVRAGAWNPRAIHCTGDYATWEDALADSDGYDDPHILQQTLAAARQVLTGKAAYERDAVVFAEQEYRYPLLWALYRSALRHGRLHVLDFGGSLASTYYQHRLVLPTGSTVWSVVEQPAHVAAGRVEFATECVSFHESINEAFAERALDVLLLSGVLQSLPDPESLLDEARRLGFASIIIDRLPLMLDDTMRLTVQRVPGRIYRGSYPAWFFSKTRLLSRLLPSYHLVAEWTALDRVQPRGGIAHHLGLLLELK
jgi:putative methyltransferase (TIGR04325 family)